MHTFLRLLFFTLICFNSSYAQHISSRVLDKKTLEPIPYATVQFSQYDGIITNEEGRFSYSLEKTPTSQDSLIISSVGYDRTAFALNTTIDSVLYIEPKAIELKSVFISNKNLSIEEIIENVEDRLSQNYNRDLSEKKIFLRESFFNNIHKTNIKVKKSSIEELNKDLIDSIVRSIPKKASAFTESLATLYGNYEKQKLNIVKAARLYDKNNEGTIKQMSERIQGILKKNVKPNSYLKIKSGWFLGTKIQVDSLLKDNAEAAELKEDVENHENKNKKNYFLKYKKRNLKLLLSEVFFEDDAKLNFINKSGRYEFELKDYTYMDDSSAYVIDFKPKGSQDFKGTFYVNTEDFAIMRIDYENVNPLRSISLFGFNYRESVFKGKTIFKKDPQTQKYDIQFIELQTGGSAGVDRPLKIIEKNKFVKGRRKQNELSLNIDVQTSNLTKYELVIYNSKTISEASYNASKENNNIDPQYMSRYNPDFWKGHHIMEPNAAIKQFEVIEE